jgi:hypothetical protein
MWANHPSTKEKLAAQKCATALLDSLAPESPVVRAGRPRSRIERHRTPGGCVLQAAHAAISVSWFPEAADGSPLGELRVIVWDGVVVRRGAASGGKGAKVIAEMTFVPLDPPRGAHVWKSSDGGSYTTPALAELCLELLEQQISVSEVDHPPTEKARA